MRGQSLIELIVAMAVLVIAISSIIYLVLNTYVLSLEGEERTKALAITEEGQEAVRSIRDNNWSDLTTGDRCVVLSGGNWVFQDPPCSVIDNKFTRVISINNVDTDEKKISSRVSWQTQNGEDREITLNTYLTNWQ